MRPDALQNGWKGILPRNATLASLSPGTLEKISHQLSPVDLPQGFLLVKSEGQITWIYFLERGMASITSMDTQGMPVEVGIVGREGIVGIHALLGQYTTQNKIAMQGSGHGHRVRADFLREQCLRNEDLLLALHTFTYALLEQTTQLVMCNRLHELEARLARWLLMSSDFMETATLHLTQEFLAEMLGVGRPAVTIAAGILQRSGLIVYSRGNIEIIDRSKLQEVACECYHAIRATYRKVYPAISF